MTAVASDAELMSALASAGAGHATTHVTGNCDSAYDITAAMAVSDANADTDLAQELP
jgi:hypothetical protein